jgi:hypothetical protein
VWIREGAIGVKFDQNIDLGELLAGRKPRHGLPSTPAASRRELQGVLCASTNLFTVDVHDFPLGGMKVSRSRNIASARRSWSSSKACARSVERVRWYSDRKAGIVFDQPLSFEELAEWVGKRLELASLKASYKWI